MSDLSDVLVEAAESDSPGRFLARMRDLLNGELARGTRELAEPRTGYEEPVVVAIAAAAAGLLIAAAPVAAAARADAARVGERAWRLAAALVGALVAACDPGPALGRADLRLQAGSLDGHLVLAVPVRDHDAADAADVAALAFEEQVAGVDRLRARAVVVPPAALEGIQDLRAPAGAHHPLLIAEIVARAGGSAADPEAADALDDTITAVLGPPDAGASAHDDLDPARRAARRILRRLDGMGKWGGYHTSFDNLARGFAGNERALAARVGEALLDAGLLGEKTSVGQRHVFLNPSRSADIRRLIAEGAVPPGLDLPAVD